MKNQRGPRQASSGVGVARELKEKNVLGGVDVDCNKEKWVCVSPGKNILSQNSWEFEIGDNGACGHPLASCCADSVRPWQNCINCSNT